MRRFLSFLVIYAIVIFALHLMFGDWPWLTESVKAATPYYVDYSTGSNSNTGTSKGSPWKSAPGMQQGAGCGGATHSYTASPGDQIIFKGGVTWPAACFGMTISVSGTSISTVSGYNQAPVINGAIYFGVDVTWFTGGSFTRPIFDMANATPTGTNGVVITTTGNFITLDDLEIKRNQQAATKSGNCTSGTINISGSASVVIDRLFVHDWTIGTLGNLDAGHNSGSICSGLPSKSNQNVYNTEMSDKNTTAALPYGSCFVEVSGEIAWNNCHDVGEGGLFTHGSFHDNQIHDLDGSPVSLQTNPVIHSNGYESDGTPPVFYNNLMYNLNIDFNRLCQSQFVSTFIFNNVGWNSKVPIFALDDNTGGGACNGTTSSLSFIYNNIEDGAASPWSGAHGTFRVLNRGTQGTIWFGNNISVTTTPAFDFTPQHLLTNHNMSASEAVTYGFNPAGKYSPSSSDPSTVAQGTNLTSTTSPQIGCGSQPALCFDTSGAPWFGGSPKARPTGSTSWDMGAFQFAGGTTGPPTVSFTSPSSGNVSGSVTMTVTATPQGSATISSCQFFIDGFAFGPADTSSPYTTTWNSVTASNARAHTLTATCTDSLSNQGSASPIMATPTNSHTNGFVSDSLWAPNIPSQAFTPQTSGTVTYPICITPYSTTANNNEVGLSQALPSGYANFSAIISIQPTGYIQVYKGPSSGYTADPTATSYPVVANTQYCFNWTINMTAGTSTVVETSPGAATIATNYPFRAAATSLGFLSAFATTNSTPDTVEVANFAVPAVPTLSFSPGNLSFPNTVATMTSMQTDSVTITNPNATISSAVVSGTGFSLDGSSTCSGTISVACTYVVDFTPATAGNFSGTLTVTGNQTGSPQVFTLSGTGVAASPTITPSLSSLDFGNVRLANPSVTYFAGPISVAITNAPTTFTSVAPSGGDAADFGVSSNSCTSTVSVSPCIIVAKFTPSRIGLETTTLVISSSDASNSPQNITLTGTGTLAAPPTAPSNSMFMASVEKVFQVPVSFKQRFTGTVPFTAMIDFVCSGCNLATGICESCVSQ